MSGFTCRKCGVFVWKGGYDPLRLCEVCSSSAKKCSRCGSADLRGSINGEWVCDRCFWGALSRIDPLSDVIEPM
jgi:ribosomal protein L37AE/L43A